MPADAQTVPLAVVAVLSAVLCWPVGSVAGVLLGHLALHRIRRTGEPGRRFAVLGLVLGYAGLLGALAVGAFVALTTFGIPPQAG